MTKRFRKLTIPLIVLPVVVAVSWLGSSELRRLKLQAAYDAIQIGDSHDRVVELMGTEQESEACRIPDNSGQCNADFYSSLFERWIVYIDSSKGVIDKVNNKGLF